MSPNSLQLLQPGFGLGGWIPRSLDSQAVIASPQAGLEGDKYWMARALLAAMEGNGRASPNPNVGAVLVKNGVILGQGATLSYGNLHAERVALASVDPASVRGATCYVTLEPCAHQGKQPACTTALIQAGIARCVIATGDPHPQVAGAGIYELQKAGIEVTLGCLQGESRAWHFPFLASLTQSRPVLIGKWAQTLDGHLADDHGVSRWISGPRSRAYTHWLRQKYDGILVGIGTVLADAPSLTVRDAAPPRHRHPHKIVFDPYGRLGQAGPEVLQSLRRELQARGPHLYWMVQHSKWRPPHWWPAWQAITVPVLLDEKGSWEQHLLQLGQAYRQKTGVDLQAVMVEGGAQLLTQLLRADLLDALHVFLRAGILGGEVYRIGRLPVRDNEESQLVNPRRALLDRHDFRLIASQQIDDDIVLECAHRRWTFW